MRWGGQAIAAAIAGMIMSAAQAQPSLPPGFVDASTLVPGLATEMRYAGTHNFVGRKIAGYEKPVCILTRKAAEALAQVQVDLASSGVGLKVYDCYRPTRAVAHFQRWARDLADTRTKGEFYPDIDKRNLFRDGYIASRSGHSRGSTVDLTLVTILPGPDGNPRAVDMGTPYDFFSPLSWPGNQQVGDDARANRKILADAMIKRGFIPYDKEWWHFTLRNEPFPETFFDFPVE